MRVVALAGGVGAGKFLRGLVRVVAAEDVTVIVNTGDDIVLHGLHVSPDLDSVTYWLAGVADRERGWGRAGETFRATGELRRVGAEDAWFALGDLDLATHLLRTRLLSSGVPLSSATREVTRRFEIGAIVLPMTDDPVTTRIEAVDEAGSRLDLHFQEYWVKRGARDEVKSIRYEGAASAEPAPGALATIAAADAVIICPSNPIASIGPILAVPGIETALAGRRASVAGVSPIVGGAPLRGMADKLLPVAGMEVSAMGAAARYRGVIGSWVIDEADSQLRGEIEEQGVRVAVADTIMADDDVSAALARVALELAGAA